MICELNSSTHVCHVVTGSAVLVVMCVPRGGVRHMKKCVKVLFRGEYELLALGLHLTVRVVCWTHSLGQVVILPIAVTDDIHIYV